MSNSLPRIFVFSTTPHGDAIAYALAEDGTVLGSHICSHESYAPHDLGVTNGSRPDRHAHYAKHYPDGYQMEFVRHAELATHQGVIEATRLNHLMKDTET